MIHYIKDKRKFDIDEKHGDEHRNYDENRYNCRLSGRGVRDRQQQQKQQSEDEGDRKIDQKYVNIGDERRANC